MSRQKKKPFSQVPLIIEHLAIASEECFVCWLVLSFRELKGIISIQLSKNISLYHRYRGGHEFESR